MKTDDPVNDDQLEITINDLLEIHGYDFTNYSKASLKRRISRLFLLNDFPDFETFRDRVKYDPEYLPLIVQEIMVNVTEMFRDPVFYKALRDEVLPVLATYPFIRIWHAGCSTGEEVYSMAILLEEAKLTEKSLLYATDLNPEVLEKVRNGIFPLKTMALYNENYVLSGGREDFSRYYTSKYDFVKFDEGLNRKMILSTHNLVSDNSFNEFQLILCRNVLIYFDENLQNKVLTLFDQSLEPLGFLGLGAKETLNHSPLQTNFSQLKSKQKIWRKIQ